MCYGCFTHSWEGFAKDRPSLTQAFFCNSCNTRWQRKPAQLLAGWVHPPLSVMCWLTGTAALLHTCCGARQEGEQNFLRINSIKNMSELKFLHSKLNLNLPKVQGCSGLRLSFSRVSGDLRNLIDSAKRKTGSRDCVTPGAFPPAEPTAPGEVILVADTNRRNFPLLFSFSVEH